MKKIKVSYAMYLKIRRVGAMLVFVLSNLHKFQLGCLTIFILAALVMLFPSCIGNQRMAPTELVPMPVLPSIPIPEPISTPIHALVVTPEHMPESTLEPIVTPEPEMPTCPLVVEMSHVAEEIPVVPSSSTETTFVLNTILPVSKQDSLPAEKIVIEMIGAPVAAKPTPVVKPSVKIKPEIRSKAKPKKHITKVQYYYVPCLCGKHYWVCYY